MLADQRTLPRALDFGMVNDVVDALGVGVDATIPTCFQGRRAVVGMLAISDVRAARLGCASLHLSPVIVCPSHRRPDRGAGSSDHRLDHGGGASANAGHHGPGDTRYRRRRDTIRRRDTQLPK
jgi:hypothetical protein